MGPLRRRRIVRSVVLFAFVVVAGCSSELGKAVRERVHGSAPAVASAPAVPMPLPEPPALEAEPFAPVEVAPGEVAWISAPVGAREKRPVIVGVHGAGDRPDWACSAWREVAANHAFV